MRLRAGSWAAIVVTLSMASPARGESPPPPEPSSEVAPPTTAPATEPPTDANGPDANGIDANGTDANGTDAAEQPAEPAPPDAYPPARRAPPEGLPYPEGIVVVEAPHGPPPAPPAMERRTGLMVTGIVLTGLGAIATITGAALLGEVEERNHCQDNQLLSCEMPAADRRQRDAGIAIGMVGLGLIGVGIPLTVVGARQRPVSREVSAALRLTPTAGRLVIGF